MKRKRAYVNNNNIYLWRDLCRVWIFRAHSLFFSTLYGHSNCLPYMIFIYVQRNAHGISGISNALLYDVYCLLAATAMRFVVHHQNDAHRSRDIVYNVMLFWPPPQRKLRAAVPRNHIQSQSISSSSRCAFDFASLFRRDASSSSHHIHECVRVVVVVLLLLLLCGSRHPETTLYTSGCALFM